MLVKQAMRVVEQRDVTTERQGRQGGITMSYYLRMFCSSNRAVPRRAILDFIEEGVYFDDPQFVPTAESPELDDPKWREFTVIYQQNQRPIDFHRDEGKELSEDVKVATEALEASASSIAQHSLVSKLQQCQQVFAIEVNPSGLSDDCWMMLDCLEAFLAKQCEGVIFAPDDGFFDADLKRICSV